MMHCVAVETEGDDFALDLGTCGAADKPPRLASPADMGVGQCGRKVSFPLVFTVVFCYSVGQLSEYVL